VKITRSQLRRIIKEEISRLIETPQDYHRLKSYSYSDLVAIIHDDEHRDFIPVRRAIANEAWEEFENIEDWQKQQLINKSQFFKSDYQSEYIAFEPGDELSFTSAWEAAVELGEMTFAWRGKTYNTRDKGQGDAEHMLQMRSNKIRLADSLGDYGDILAIAYDDDHPDAEVVRSAISNKEWDTLGSLADWEKTGLTRAISTL